MFSTSIPKYRFCFCIRHRDGTRPVDHEQGVGDISKNRVSSRAVTRRAAGEEEKNCDVFLTCITFL